MMSVVSRATPFLRKGSGILQCNGLFDFRGVLPPQTYMWFAYCATACTHYHQNNQLHCIVPDTPESVRARLRGVYNSPA